MRRSVGSSDKYYACIGVDFSHSYLGIKYIKLVPVLAMAISDGGSSAGGGYYLELSLGVEFGSTLAKMRLGAPTSMARMRLWLAIPAAQLCSIPRIINVQSSFVSFCIAGL